MDTAKKAGVPIVLPILAVIAFAAMFCLATFYPNIGKTGGPEKNVENFYAAYADSDHQGMAENLSVFWSLQFLPQYGGNKPSELIEKRPEIEKDTAEILSSTTTDVDTELKIKVLPEYTQEWNNTAMVVYAGFKDEEELGREVALLVKEKDSFYMYIWMPIYDDESIEALKSEFSEFDTYYSEVLTNDEW